MSGELWFWDRQVLWNWYVKMSVSSNGIVCLKVIGRQIATDNTGNGVHLFPVPVFVLVNLDSPDWERIVSVLKHGNVSDLNFTLFSPLWPMSNSDTFLLYRFIPTTFSSSFNIGGIPSGNQDGGTNTMKHRKREDQELDNGTCFDHIKSEVRTQTFMLHARPNPIWTVKWVNFDVDVTIQIGYLKFPPFFKAFLISTFVYRSAGRDSFLISVPVDGLSQPVSFHFKPTVLPVPMILAHICTQVHWLSKPQPPSL